MSPKLSQIKNKEGTIVSLGATGIGRQIGLVKRVALALFALLPLVACGPKTASKAPASAAQPAAKPAAPPPSAPLPGLAVIHDLYKPSLTPMPDRVSDDPFFAEDLARALKARSHPGRDGALDFDYRYGAQTVDVSEVTVTAVNTLEGERVTARFNNIGKPYEVDYDLVETRDGWRIADVSAPAQQGDPAWDLRQRFKLPAIDSEPDRRP
jgi:hypothetical protein